MRRSLAILALLIACALTASASDEHSYLFAWCGDVWQNSSDFLAVIDSDPQSAHYGKVLASAPTGHSGLMAHHTEAEMPAGGLLMANDFELGRTWIFDVRQPLVPRVVTSFGRLGAYMHPHTFLRLPSGNVLATFQYQGGDSPGAAGGGLVEVNNNGQVLRSASAMDPAARKELIRPYSLALLPKLDRVVTTNNSMRFYDEGNTRSVQVWQFSNLHLLQTIILQPAPRGHEQYGPGEPRVLEDGKSVLIHTFSCGLYLMRGVDSQHPSVRFVYRFPGDNCGVPLLAGRWWIQTVPALHGLMVLDISDPEHPREVSHVILDQDQAPHWIALDSSGTRIVTNSDENGPDHRLFIVNFSPHTGSVKLDKRFRDAGSANAGISTDGKTWPHGFRGNAYCHGTVFSRP